MDRMFYLEWGFWMVTAIILSGVRQEHAVWIWRLFAVLVGVDLVVSCFLGREWWNFGMILLMLLYSFGYLPFRSRQSVCPHCGHRLFYKPLIGNMCPDCCASFMADSQMERLGHCK